MASTTTRGYGYDHRKARKVWKAKVEAGIVYCARCRGRIYPHPTLESRSRAGKNHLLGPFARDLQQEGWWKTGRSGHEREKKGPPAGFAALRSSVPENCEGRRSSPPLVASLKPRLAEKLALRRCPGRRTPGPGRSCRRSRSRRRWSSAGSWAGSSRGWSSPSRSR
jgi:hypothetical protein